MLTSEEKEQFNLILEEIGKSVDITPIQYEAAVTSYKAVGSWLSDKTSSLAPYLPEILPQGGFLLGTMVRPIGENDELDIDLVCRLTGKQQEWTQYDLKEKVGDRLKDNAKYKKMLDDEKRRCWTLQYAESSKFHMDILPSLVGAGYKIIFEKAFSALGSDASGLAIRITDNEEINYRSEKNPDYWPKSNPFGYAIWFNERASLALRKAMSLNENIQPVPANTEEKLPLQRAIQILKRHRDLMFDGDENRPISIIITTLAARAYKKETSLIDTLIGILNQMRDLIEDRFDPRTGEYIKWIPNPINLEENFADKWAETPQKKTNFYKWLDAVQRDFDILFKTSGVPQIAEKLKELLGEKAVTEAFSALGKNALASREKKNFFMEKETGILKTSIASSTGMPVKNHNFHGQDDSAA
ncbi:MAG: hypothetical protein FD123_410 [Bacteroidetes bacterium]|nr:MAG: hypothetical protein FD123_410 [Bacteroidota bacterium]